MERQLRKIPQVLGLLMLLASGIATVPAAAQQSLSERDVRDLVEGLQNGTLRPAIASAHCTAKVDGDPDGHDIREVMATYLEVPSEAAVEAFCSALVLAIRRGDMTLDDLLPVVKRQNTATGFFQFGRLLRAIYLNHREASTASVAGGAVR